MSKWHEILVGGFVMNARVLHIAVLSGALVSLSAPSRADDPKRPHGETLTEDECRNFASQWLAAIESEDAEQCSQLYDIDAFIDRHFGQIEFLYRDRKEALAEWKRGFRQAQVLYRAPLAIVSLGGTARLVSVHPAADTKHLIVRLIYPNGLCDYQLLTLGRNDAGELRVVDCTTAGSGDALKDLMETMLTRFARFEGPDRMVFADAPNSEQLVQDKRLLGAMFELAKKSDFLGVIHDYNFLSPELQTDRFVLIFCLQASIQALPPDAATYAGSEFAKSLDRSVSAFEKRYRENFPGDKSVDLILLDRHIRTGHYDDALASVDALDKWVGGDPYLDTIRADLHRAKGDLPAAREAAERSLRHEPDIIYPYIALARIASEQGDEARVEQVRKQLTERLGPEAATKLAEALGGTSKHEEGGSLNQEQAPAG